MNYYCLTSHDRYDRRNREYSIISGRPRSRSSLSKEKNDSPWARVRYPVCGYKMHGDWQLHILIIIETSGAPATAV